MLGVYVGTFDPFHMGHLEVVQWAATLCTKVLVMIVNNPKKTCALDLSWRSDFARLVLADANLANNVLVLNCQQTLDAKIRLAKSKGLKVVGFLGTDVATSQPKYVPYETCFVVPRHDMPFTHDPNGWHIPVHVGDSKTFCYQFASSTVLKGALCTNNMTMVNTMCYQETHRQLLLSQFLDCLSVWTGNPNLALEAGVKSTLLDVRGHVHQWTLPRSYNGVQIVVKTVKEPGMLDRECSAFRHFCNIDTPHTPTLVWAGNGCLVTTYVGSSLMNLARFGDLSPEMTGRLAGKALAELHAHNILREPAREHIVACEKFVKLQSRVHKDVLEAYLQDPGVLCLTHGDTNLGNFCLDKNNVVSLIDLVGASPCGIPSYDYYQFLSSLYHHLGWSDFTTTIAKSFNKSYFEHATHEFTSAAKCVCQIYWNVPQSVLP